MLAWGDGNKVQRGTCELRPKKNFIRAYEPEKSLCRITRRRMCEEKRREIERSA